MYKVSSGTLNSVLRDSQTFALRKADFRYVTVERQIFVTLQVTQYVVTGKIYTLVSGCQPHTIQIVRAHVRDLTMGAVSQRHQFINQRRGSVLTSVEWCVVKREHLSLFGMYKHVDTDIRSVATVAPFYHVYRVVRVIAGTDVQGKRFALHAVETAVHQQFTAWTLDTEQITARCNITQNRLKLTE